MSYEVFLQDLDKLSHRGMRKSIDAFKEVLIQLNHPDKNFPIVHVAGTNGKGSSCTFLASLMSQNGYRVGLALSPHVETFHERIQFFDSQRQGHEAQIRTSELLKIHFELKSQDPHFFGLTYFEYSLLLAVYWFAQLKVDLVILETGLGGRFDATNACTSIVSGIVSIGFDHMEELGETLPKILLEKIDIVKPHTDFVFAPRDEDLVKIAKDFCSKREARFHAVGQHHEFFLKNKNLNFPEIFKKNLEFSLTLADCLRSKGFRFDNTQSYVLHLPVSRTQFLKTDPVIMLDGAHNTSALSELKRYILKNWGEKYDLVFGCLKDRPACELAREIVPQDGVCYWTKFSAPDRENTTETLKQLQKYYGGEIIELSLESVRRLAVSDRNKPLIVCGSFYLCGAFLKLYQESRSYET